MFTNVNRIIRKGLLGAILAGATIFSAPTTGCDASSVKDVAGNAARPTGYIYQPWSWER